MPQSDLPLEAVGRSAGVYVDGAAESTVVRTELPLNRGKTSRGFRTSGRRKVTDDVERLREGLDADDPELAVGSGARRRDVVYRDNERVGAGLDRSERLLLGAADGADVAEQVELACNRDPVAVEKVAAAQAVVDVERERQAGGGAADPVDRVAHVDRDALDPDGVADLDTDDRAVLPVGRGDRAQGLRAGVGEGVLLGVARREPLGEADEIPLAVNGVAVDGGDDVTRADAGLRRREAVRHGVDERAESGDLNGLPERALGDDLGGPLRVGHRLEVLMHALGLAHARGSQVADRDQ